MYTDELNSQWLPWEPETENTCLNKSTCNVINPLQLPAQKPSTIWIQSDKLENGQILQSNKTTKSHFSYSSLALPYTPSQLNFNSNQASFHLRLIMIKILIQIKSMLNCNQNCKPRWRIKKVRQYNLKSKVKYSAQLTNNSKQKLLIDCQSVISTH